eukprot:369935-Rhodomonas_salina.3
MAYGPARKMSMEAGLEGGEEGSTEGNGAGGAEGGQKTVQIQRGRRERRQSIVDTLQRAIPQPCAQFLTPYAVAFCSYMFLTSRYRTWHTLSIAAAADGGGYNTFPTPQSGTDYARAIIGCHRGGARKRQGSRGGKAKRR